MLQLDSFWCKEMSLISNCWFYELFFLVRMILHFWRRTNQLQVTFLLGVSITVLQV